MNDEANHITDDELVRVLSAALDAAEPIPEAALHAAYAAVDMGRLAEELAALVFDSAAERDLLSMRGTEAEARLLSFVNDHLSVDLELHADGRTIVGQLTPATDAALHVETESGDVIEVETDSFGRFRVAVPPVPVRLRVAGLLLTPWISR